MTNRVGSNWYKTLTQVEKLNKDFTECATKLKQVYRRKNRTEALTKMLTPKSDEGENENGNENELHN